jgi:putative transposase
MRGRAYRALLLKYDILGLPPEVQQKIPALLRAQEEFRRWAAEWAKSGGKVPMPEENPLRYLAHKFVHAYSALEWLRGHTIKRGIRAPLVLDAQLRLNNERDVSMGVLVDAARRKLRIRKLGIGTIVLPLPEGAVKYTLERAREGARLVMAMVWIKGGRLCVALVFRREVEPVEPKRVLAVDLNALHNGIAYAVVERDRVLRRGVLRPHLRRPEKLQREVSKLDSLCARRGDPYCERARAAKSRLYRLLGEWQRETARFIVRLALQYRAAIAIDVPDDGSMRELKKNNSYPADGKALLNFGKLRRLIEGLAEWHGVPYIEAKLYSTVCPNCGTKMLELQNRRVGCPRCGLEAGRDEVPAMWAQRRFGELLKMAKSRTPSFSGPEMLITARLHPTQG